MVTVELNCCMDKGLHRAHLSSIIPVAAVVLARGPLRGHEAVYAASQQMPQKMQRHADVADDVARPVVVEFVDPGRQRSSSQLPGGGGAGAGFALAPGWREERKLFMVRKGCQNACGNERTNGKQPHLVKGDWMRRGNMEEEQGECNPPASPPVCPPSFFAPLHPF